MSEIEQVLRNIQALRESIQIDWDDLHSNPHREEERSVVRAHLEACQAELQTLVDRFLALNESRSG